MADNTKILATGVIILLASGGVVATTGVVTPGFSTGERHSQGPPQNIDAAATLENGTVTVTVLDERDSGVSNVTVSVDDNPVGTSGAAGTVTFNLTSATDGDDLTISLAGNGFTASLDYHVTDERTLVLREESYEYSRQPEDDD